MLASYEFHGTHPGWHVHAGCGDTSVIPIGRYMGPWKLRIPRDWKESRQTDWNVDTQEAAMAKASEVFGIPISSLGNLQLKLV